MFVFKNISFKKQKGNLKGGKTNNLSDYLKQSNYYYAFSNGKFK